MRIVTIPPPVNAKPVGNGPSEEISFKKFVMVHLDSYSAIKTWVQIRQAGKIADKLEQGTESVALEDAEYDILKGALGEIKYLPGVARQLIAFYDAFEGAQEV